MVEIFFDTTKRESSSEEVLTNVLVRDVTVTSGTAIPETDLQQLEHMFSNPILSKKYLSLSFLLNQPRHLDETLLILSV